MLIPRARQPSHPGDASESLHQGLTSFNALRLSPRGPSCDWRRELCEEALWRQREHSYLERERAAIQALLPRDAGSPEAFEAWFRRLEAGGPGQGDELFSWLADEASLEDMRWFLTQETAGEAGFDDLVALTQVKLPQRAKLELARNYWDEMGRGRAAAMHGELLAHLVRSLDLQPAVHTTVWPALALGNLMIGLAADRHYAYHSLGALGAIELTAPGRVVQVARGLERLGFSKQDRLYFEVHATLDLKHAHDWITEVLVPLACERPETTKWFAEGALMRLNAGARCFARYREELPRPLRGGR